GVKFRAGPAELGEIDIDDHAETPVVPGALPHAAGRVVEQIAKVGEAESYSLLLPGRAPIIRTGDRVREIRWKWR
ncbi:MAG TPA: hypothetical protein VGF42_06855, partial [Caulobacteraceae bacterium]